MQHNVSRQKRYSGNIICTYMFLMQKMRIRHGTTGGNLRISSTLKFCIDFKIIKMLFECSRNSAGMTWSRVHHNVVIPRLQYAAKYS